MKNNGTRGISLILLPMISCLIMTIHLILAVVQTNAQYGKRSIAAALLALFIWILIFFISQKTGRMTANIAFIPFFVIVILLSFYVCYTIWGSGYLTLAPYENLEFGLQHKDTLFHSAIAESYKRLGAPTNLLNEETRLYYHTFSHLLLAIISGILNMPSFIAYNFLYPILFVPVYLFAQLFAISSSKKYFKKERELRLFDLIYILLFNCGSLFYVLLGYLGAGKSSYLISESFLIANTIMLFSLATCFHALINKEKSHKGFQVLIWITIPIEIFLICWAKISVGIIFFACVVFYIIRSSFKNTKAWLLVLLYSLVLICCVGLFKGFQVFNIINPFRSKSDTGVSATTYGQTAFLPFSYDLYCSGKLGIWGYALLIAMPFLIFAYFEIKCFKNYAIDEKKKSKVWIETGAVCLLTGLLPVLLLHIAGGSASYFSSVVPIVMMVFICGHHYFDLNNGCSNLLRKEITLFCFIIAAILAFLNIPANNPLEFITGESNSGFIEHIREIQSITRNNPSEYTIYLDSDSYIARVFRNNNRSVFIYPALTGVGVINASYQDNDGLYYVYCGSETDNYGTTAVKHGRLSLDQALEKAKENGKKYMIHMMSNSFRVIELENREVVLSKTIIEKARFLRINAYQQFTYNKRAVPKVENRKLKLIYQGTMQSPIYNLDYGVYHIIFLGDNLQICDYSIANNPETPEGMAFDAIFRNDSKIVYQLTVNKKTTGDMCFEVKNPSRNEAAMVRQIMVEQIVSE